MTSQHRTIVCPECRAPLTRIEDILVCDEHGRVAGVNNGVVDFSEAEKDIHEEFLTSYRTIRAREGRGSTDPEWYRRLPEVAQGSAHAREWRLRSESLAWLKRYLTEGDRTEGDRTEGNRTEGNRTEGNRNGDPPLAPDSRVLDAGAGNCWLSHHLIGWGYRVVALDLNNDEFDGLGAARSYPPATLEHLERICAPFKPLPFADESFDLIVYNGAFHYALDDRKALAEAVRVLRPGGRIIIIDSPFYRDASSGERMLAERGERGRAGYLVYEHISQLAKEFNMEARYHLPNIGFLRRIKRRLTEIRLGREIATMPRTIISN